MKREDKKMCNGSCFEFLKKYIIFDFAEDENKAFDKVNLSYN
jgi:hypothetical protein